MESGGAKQLVATKLLRPNAPAIAREKFSMELRLLTENNFDHPNIVTLHGVCTLVSSALRKQNRAILLFSFGKKKSCSSV